MWLVGERAIVGIDEGDQLVGHDLREAGEVEPRAGGPAGAAGGGRGTTSRPAGEVVAAVVHHDDERPGLARRDEVVQDQVRAPLVPPSRLVFERAVLQIQYRI